LKIEKNQLNEQFNNLKTEISQYKGKSKEVENLIKVNEKQEEKLLEIQQERESETKMKLEDAKKTLNQYYKDKEQKLALLGANSIDHALNLVSSILSLSKSIQLHQHSLGSLQNFSELIYRNFLTQLKRIESRGQLEVSLDSGDLVTNEDLAKWAEKTWKDQNIVNKIRETGLDGGALAEASPEQMEKFMEEIGVQGEARRYVWIRKWQSIKAVTTAQERIKFLKMDVAFVQDMFAMKNESAKNAIRAIADKA